MPRITRKQQKIFAESASNNGVFGSLQAADPTLSSDPDTIQGRSAYAQGWNDATFSSELLPPLEEFQALQYVFSRQIAYIMQEGIPEWDSSTTYYKGNIVKIVSGDEYTLFESIVDNNTGNLTSDTTKWKVCGVSQDFNTGIHLWRSDVTYGLGDWVRGIDGNGEPDIFQSLQASNKGNAVTNLTYWKPLGVAKTTIPLLSCMWMDHAPDDASWLRGDTWSWQSGDIYKAAYDYLEDQYTNGTQTSETKLWTNVVGSPIITNGVVSNFSQSNYLYSPYKLLPGNKTWSLETNVNTSSGTSRRIIIGCKNADFHTPIILVENNKILLLLSSNGTSWDISSSVTSSASIPLGQDFSVRLSFDGSKYTVDCSTDDWTTTTNYITVNSSAIIYQGDGEFDIGNNAVDLTQYWPGSVDLKKTKLTIDGVVVWYGATTLQYTVGTNGMKIVSAANAGAVQDIFESDGVAWYYILDTVNKQFKLPRTRYGFVGLRDTVGNYVLESLPNITGEFTPGAYNTYIYGTGAFTGHTGNRSEYSGGSAGGYYTFSAHDSNNTYQDNAPVQQRATQMYLYFYVGNTVRNQTEVDVGEITEALNQKWDSSNMQVVSALPENPQTGVFYFVK